MRTDIRSEEPAVQVLDITQDGETRVTASQSPTQPLWLALAIIAALIAGLGYGFVLGRGDKPADKTEAVPATDAQPATSTGMSTGLDPSPTRFQRSTPDHNLGPGVTEYLDHRMVQTTAVDTNGLVWGGGPAGAVRLDPTTGRFERLTGSDGTGPLDIHDLAAGPDGTMYAATGRGLSYWDGFEWAPDSVLTHQEGWGPPPVQEVGPLAVAPDGTVWLVSHEWSGWNAQSYVHYGSAPFSGDVPTMPIDGFVHALEVQPDGTVWLLADDQVWRYDGSWTKVLAGGWMSAITVDAAGTAWVGREGDIVALDDSANTAPVRWAEAVDLNPDLAWGPAGFVRHLASTPTGPVWAVAETWEPEDPGETSTVLISIQDGVVVATPLPESGDDQWIEDLEVAPNGDLWIAVGGGLMRFDGTAWTEFSPDGGPTIGSVASIAVGPRGNLWLAGYGGITRFASGEWHRVGTDQLDALGVEEGEVWVASGGGAVWAGIGCRAVEYRQGGWTALPPLPEGPGECRRGSAAAAEDGSLWLAAIGPYGGETDVYRWNGHTWTAVGTADLDASDIDIGPDGAAWLVGWEGFGVLGEEGWRRLVTAQAFQHVAVAADGTVLASVDDWQSSGLWQYADGAWEIEQRNSVDWAAVAFARHPDGSVWVLERKGDGGAVVRSAEGRGRSIVDSGDLHSMAIAPDGTIWVAGHGRVYRVETPGSGQIGLTPVDWRIELDEAGPGVHTAHMRVIVHGLAHPEISHTSGRLFWDQTGVELCRIGVDLDDGSVEVGDIFQTTEGCGSNPTALQDAFDEFGLPEDACIFVHRDDGNLPVSYCAPLVPDETP